MPFLQAGFNPENRTTGIRGWTRHVRGSTFAPATLHQFDCGDYFWLGAKPNRFVAWTECVVLVSWGFVIASEHQWNLPQCDIATRREVGRWVRGEWVEPTA